MSKTLVIGYGNPDREDDGVAWHILQQLAAHYDCPIATLDELDLDQTNLATETGPESASSPPRLRDTKRSRFPASSPPHLVFALQLTPEMAEALARCQRVCFIDAHTGAYPEEVRIVSVEPGYQPSAFTHHLTPETCLTLARTLYGCAPEGLIVSVRGYHFGYGSTLSPQTAALVQPAVAQIIDHLNSAISRPTP
jgi:Ni,Fe-hydrogenase maturation factor